MREYLTSLDMFGHSVTLNFNKKGVLHKTQIGGIFSIFVRCIMAFYIILLFKWLILRERNVIGTQAHLLDLDIEVPITNLTETKVGMFGYILGSYGQNIEYNDEFKKHFKIFYAKYQRDLSQSPILVNLEPVPAVKCSSKFFEGNSQASKRFKAKKGDPYYFCPASIEDVELEGTHSYDGMVQSWSL